MHISVFFHEKSSKYAFEDYTVSKVTVGTETGLNASPSSGVATNACRETAVEGNTTQGSGVGLGPFPVLSNSALFYRFLTKFTMLRGILVRIKCLDAYPILNRAAKIESSI